MTVVRGLIRKATALYGSSPITPITHQYTIDTFVGEEGRFSAGQPVTLTSEHHQCDQPAAKPEGPLTAAGLSPAHMGDHVSVKVLGGAVIEDQLLTMHTDFNDKRPRIWLSFKHVMSSLGTDSDPFAVFPAGSFAVLPDTEVTIVKEPGE